MDVLVKLCKYEANHCSIICDSKGLDAAYMSTERGMVTHNMYVHTVECFAVIKKKRM